MNAQPGGDSALEMTIRRLDRAISLLEQRLADRVARAGADATGLFDQDRAKLAAELDQSRARERELEEAGAAASEALGRAIAEIKATLGEAAARAGEEA
ncbi:MAG TPA: DUF4164 family protein [Phenylobacterium sp.]